MAVRIVPGDSIFQPKNLSDAEIAAEGVVLIFASESVVALSALAEQALFSGEQGTAAVYFDAATLEDYAVALVRRLPRRSLQLFIDVGYGQRIFLLVDVFSPALEQPVRV